MAEIVDDYYEIVIRKPALKVGSVYVTPGSEKDCNPVDAVRFAAQYKEPLQTCDLVAIIRDSLGKEPMLKEDLRGIGGMNHPQRTSDFAAISKTKNGMYIVVSDLPAMYPDELERHIQYARLIGHKRRIRWNEYLVQVLAEHAEDRTARLPMIKPNYSVPVNRMKDDDVAHAFFPREGGRYGEFLKDKGYKTMTFHLLGVDSIRNLSKNYAIVQPTLLSTSHLHSRPSYELCWYEARDGKARGGSIKTEE